MLNQFTPRPSKILFIDEVYLKDTTELNDAVDIKLIRTSIQYAQDRFVLPILGSTLFEQWKAWISSGATLQNDPAYYFDSNNLFVLESFIQPILVAATMIELVYKINVQFRNKGLEQAHSEFSSNATDSQVDRLSESYREMAAFYAQRCTQYLIDNITIFQNWLNPQLGTTSNGADLFYPNQGSYNAGIYLPTLNGGAYNQGRGWGLSVNQRIAMFGNYE